MPIESGFGPSNPRSTKGGIKAVTSPATRKEKAEENEERNCTVHFLAIILEYFHFMEPLTQLNVSDMCVN